LISSIKKGRRRPRKGREKKGRGGKEEELSFRFKKKGERKRKVVQPTVASGWFLSNT